METFCDPILENENDEEHIVSPAFIVHVPKGQRSHVMLSVPKLPTGHGVHVLLMHSYPGTSPFLF
jgi:hypothetical protein